MWQSMQQMGWIGAVVMSLGWLGGPNVAGQETGDGRPAVAWAIVIHGGAGGTAERLSEERRAAKLAGLRQALEQGAARLSAGGEALDAVEHVVKLLEDDPQFNAGRGAVTTSDGRFELDAAIMDGRQRACGAVAGVQTVRNPIELARRVMERTPHVLLIGSGADQFAKEQQVTLVPQEYFAVPGINVPLPNSQSQLLHDRLEYYGTVGCVVRDTRGNLAAATSTGGLPGKRWGRIGDAPIIGAGTFADNESCAVSCTGVGEEFIRRAVAHEISAQLKYGGRSLEEAVRDVVHQQLPAKSGAVIAVDHAGRIAIDRNTVGLAWGAADSQGRNEVGL
jgi:beta-aspartyl-peptidase (threonine type)